MSPGRRNALLVARGVSLPAGCIPPARSDTNAMGEPPQWERKMGIERRHFLQSIGAAGLLGLASPREQLAQEQVARATRAMPAPKIKDISVIECQPAGVRLTV